MPSDHLTKFVFRSRMRTLYTAGTQHRARSNGCDLRGKKRMWSKPPAVSKTYDPSLLFAFRFSHSQRIGLPEHHACEPGKMFSDVQVSGPFRYCEHTHLFLPDPKLPTASWHEDRIEYQLPLGWLGRSLTGAWTRRRLKRMFSWRHRVTAQAFASRARIGKDEGNNVAGQTH
jgi:hypothetical protein